MLTVAWWALTLATRQLPNHTRRQRRMHCHWETRAEGAQWTYCGGATWARCRAGGKEVPRSAPGTSPTISASPARTPRQYFAGNEVTRGLSGPITGLQSGGLPLVGYGPKIPCELRPDLQNQDLFILGDCLFWIKAGVGCPHLHDHRSLRPSF